jgi:hypothetical protein
MAHSSKLHIAFGICVLRRTSASEEICKLSERRWVLPHRVCYDTGRLRIVVGTVNISGQHLQLVCLLIVNF